jgi:hypothetical protein
MDYYSRIFEWLVSDTSDPSILIEGIEPVQEVKL